MKNELIKDLQIYIEKFIKETSKHKSQIYLWKIAKLAAKLHTVKFGGKE